MIKLYIFLSLIGLKSCFVFGNYNGPFLFWGVDELQNIKLSALESIDDKVLRDLYTDSSAVIMFLRNSSTKLTTQNYPGFKEIVDKTKWAYVPQKWLSSDPVDYNVNAEIIHLVGPTSQQDVEMAALYRDAILNYGKGKVLGVLATKWNGHSMQKRQAVMEETSSMSSISLSSTTPQPPQQEEQFDEDYTYIYSGKSILYTSSPPVLRIMTENPNAVGTNNTDWIINEIELKLHSFVTGDEKEQTSRLIVIFKVDDGKLTLRFRFLTTSGYWSLNSVEVEDPNRLVSTVLTVVGEAPSAPIRFSYKCCKNVTFRSENKTMSLTINGIQVQTMMGGAVQFGDAYDCIGFTTAPIWSGVLVSFLLIFAVSIAICAILDIKPPNRFENSRSKQLTFTVQE